MTEVLAFLAILGCFPEVNVVVDPTSKYLGLYKREEKMVILRSATALNVLVHELYHDCQKAPKNTEEMWEQEYEAYRIELLWKETQQ